MSTEGHVPEHNAADFRTDVDDVFGRISSRYDLLCDLFSFGIHRTWKNRVAAVIFSESWRDLLDAASGTGDVALRVAEYQRLRTDQELVVSDISPEMLGVAQRRAARRGLELKFRILDAHAMPSIPSASIDLYSISLGLKICNRTQVLREAFRILRPGGRMVALEASRISKPWLHRAYLTYMAICMPLIGWLATGGDASAYRYLLKGVQDFPGAEDLAAELVSIGFEDITFERLSLGIVAVHVARKPRHPSA